MIDVMIDVETLSLSPRAKILSVAAVPFVLQGENPKPDESKFSPYYATIREESQPDRDRDLETMRWWKDESRRRAWNALQEGMVTIDEVLVDFCLWFDALEEPSGRVWACGPDFDIAILRDAMRHRGIREPWQYGRFRDVRTLMELARVDRYTVPIPTRVSETWPEHHALGDAIRQVIQVRYAVQKMMPWLGTEELS